MHPFGTTSYTFDIVDQRILRFFHRILLDLANNKIISIKAEDNRDSLVPCPTVMVLTGILVYSKKRLMSDACPENIRIFLAKKVP